MDVAYIDRGDGNIIICLVDGKKIRRIIERHNQRQTGGAYNLPHLKEGIK